MLGTSFVNPSDSFIAVVPATSNKIAKQEFGAKLENRTGLKVNYFDERLSSFEAHEILDECGIKSVNHKEYVDEVAAMVILQGFLDELDKS